MKRIKVFSIAFMAAVAVGILIGSLFQSSYFNELKSIMDVFCDNIINHSLYLGEKENCVLIFRLIIDRMGPYVLMWLLSEGRWGIPYIMWFIVSRGIMFGFMCNFFVRAYTSIAPGLIAAFYFPQFLLYAVSFGLSIMYISRKYTKHKIMVVMILGLILIAGCVLETYINPKLLAGVISRR